VSKMFKQCPVCQGEVYVSALKCADCEMEFKTDFEMSPFDRLGAEKREFLMVFLRQRGNLKNVQQELGMSYPAVKKRLDDLLTVLELSEAEDECFAEEEVVDVRNWFVDKDSKKASEIVKQKLKEHGGKATVYTVRGLPCEIAAAADGVSFWSNKLPITPLYRFEVFDHIVDLLIANGGRARKGNGRNYKLGEAQCDDTTVVGYVAKHYSRKKDSDSVFDPVFVFAAILEWAGIASNERGELVLTASYRSLL